MFKYHGTPITPKSVFEKYMPDKNVLISYAHKGDFNRAVQLSNKIIIDNGAFSFWNKKKKVNWSEYYKWVSDRINKIDYYFIPDVIDGTELENDELIANFFDNNIKGSELYDKAVPVWHVAESFDRLYTLMRYFNYIAIGSSGDYQTLGTKQWHDRMYEVMKIVCDSDGVPKVRLHMLRCLDKDIFTKYPFYSGDSTNFARNHARDGAENILNRIEPYNSPKFFEFRFKQVSLFGNHHV